MTAVAHLRILGVGHVPKDFPLSWCMPLVPTTNDVFLGWCNTVPPTGRESIHNFKPKLCEGVLEVVQRLYRIVPVLVAFRGKVDMRSAADHL